MIPDLNSKIIFIPGQFSQIWYLIQSLNGFKLNNYFFYFLKKSFVRNFRQPFCKWFVQLNCHLDPSFLKMAALVVFLPVFSLSMRKPRRTSSYCSSVMVVTFPPSFSANSFSSLLLLLSAFIKIAAMFSFFQRYGFTWLSCEWATILICHRKFLSSHPCWWWILWPPDPWWFFWIPAPWTGKLDSSDPPPPKQGELLILFIPWFWKWE